MKIRIVDSEVISLSILPCGEIKPEENMAFSFDAVFSEHNSNIYHIIFHVEINHKNGFEYKIDFKSQFNVVSDSIDEDFKVSHFINVNSPAIAYPFLRAYVANLMLISGHDPMMLPTINFQALAEKRKET